MGHCGPTYERFYLPDFIARDFQSIYFGTPDQEQLIQRVTQIGITRDEGAPIELTDEQKLEVKNDPKLVRLREELDSCRKMIERQGFCSINAARGTKLYDQYDRTRRQIDSLRQTLRNKRLAKAIKDYHATIDTLYIERQRAGAAVPKVARPHVKFEFPERAKIAELLPQRLSGLDESQAMQLRIEFIDNLSSYCFRNESQRARVQRNSAPGHLDNKIISGTKRRLSSDNDTRAQKMRKPSQLDSNLGQSSSAPLLGVSGVGQRPEVYTEPTCLRCLRPFASRDSLRRHVELHIYNGDFKQRFQCGDPCCSAWIDGHVHFQIHSERIHGVRHAWKRSAW